jgi:hypothetical protein
MVLYRYLQHATCNAWHAHSSGGKEMSKFLTKLRIEKADESDDGKWRLTEPLFYESDIAKQTIVVPAGFETDFASVPRLPFVFLLAGDCADEAAVIHDYLYSSRMLPRATADAVLREASEVMGVPAWRRWMMWAGVRIGGASHYDPKEEKQEEPISLP